DLLFWEHHYDSSRTRAGPRSAKDFVEKDMGRNPSQLGLEKLEQGRVECARPPPISAQARRDRMDHQFSRGLETLADCQIARPLTTGTHPCAVIAGHRASENEKNRRWDQVSIERIVWIWSDAEANSTS